MILYFFETKLGALYLLREQNNALYGKLYCYAKRGGNCHKPSREHIIYILDHTIAMLFNSAIRYEFLKFKSSGKNYSITDCGIFHRIERKNIEKERDF